MPGLDTSRVKLEGMGSSSSSAAEIHSVSSVTSSSVMVGADSSAWSIRTRTQGALLAPTTSTSTTSMPRSRRGAPARR